MHLGARFCKGQPQSLGALALGWFPSALLRMTLRLTHRSYLNSDP